MGTRTLMETGAEALMEAVVVTPLLQLVLQVHKLE